MIVRTYTWIDWAKLMKSVPKSFLIDMDNIKFPFLETALLNLEKAPCSLCFNGKKNNVLAAVEGKFFSGKIFSSHSKQCKAISGMFTMTETDLATMARIGSVHEILEVDHDS